MSRPGTIYVDVDDVLARTTQRLVEFLHERHGRRVDFAALHDFDLRVSFSLSDDEHDAFLDAVHQPEFLESLEVLPGCAQVVAEWRDAGQAVHVMTGRPPQARQATLRWLECHAIAHDQLACVDKYGRHGDAPGSLALDELRSRRFDLAVEDSLVTAAFLVEHTGARVALMDRPWNRKLDALPRRVREAIVRVRDWDEIAALWRQG